MTRLISRALMALGWGPQACSAAALALRLPLRCPLPGAVTVTNGVHTATPLALVELG